MRDVVYPLSPGPSDYSELRHSLRTLEANTDVEQVWFIGGKPNWLRSIHHVRTKQPYSKWRNVRINIRTALENDRISDPFWFLNDDQYVLAPVGRAFPLWHGGGLLTWLEDLGPRHQHTQYVREGKRTYRVLRTVLDGDPAILSWSLHTPILIHKDSMLEALALDEKHGGMLHLRTLYANLAELKGERAPCHDIKSHATPRYLYASSSNASWQGSPMGREIRKRYATPSRWEGC